MLTSHVATNESEKPMDDDQFNAYVTRLVLTAVVLQQGPIAMSVGRMMEAAKWDLKWDRVGENLLLRVGPRVGEPCLK